MTFLSEKTLFSALGGPEVAIFGRDDLDPLYFDVSNFSVTPDMSKNTLLLKNLKNLKIFKSGLRCAADFY